MVTLAGKDYKKLKGPEKKKSAGKEICSYYCHAVVC